MNVTEKIKNSPIQQVMNPLVIIDALKYRDASEMAYSAVASFLQQEAASRRAYTDHTDFIVEGVIWADPEVIDLVESHLPAGYYVSTECDPYETLDRATDKRRAEFMARTRNMSHIGVARDPDHQNLPPHLPYRFNFSLPA